MRQKAIIVLIGLLLAAATSASSAYAQEITGTITGFVKDATGAVIPNVEVIVRNMGTGVERRVLTGADGEYTATFLPIGRYEVEASFQGFKKFLQRDIPLHVNDRLRVDVTLEVGAVTEVVTIEARAALVQSESAEVGSVIGSRQVREMPLNGRSLYQLVALQPGVSASSALVSGRVGVGLDVTSSVNVNGARAAQNNWLIDGSDNVDTGSNLAVINYIGIDTVAEFRILRGTYNAEFGRNGGGQINVVTKSGTNEFHGGVFEFFRNDALDARNFFTTLDRNRDGKADAALLRYHNFGWTIGGPIKKDKLFFFYGEEVRRIKTVRGGGVINTRVPTDLQRQGNFSEFPSVLLRDPSSSLPCTAADRRGCFSGNIIPSNRLDPNALALLTLIPRPNANPAVLGGNLNFTSAAPSGRNYREELIRIDYNASNAHKFFVRWVRDKIPSTEPFGEVFGTGRAAFPGIADTETTIPARSLVVEWNWVPRPNMVNNLAFNYSRGGIFSVITGQASRSLSGFSVPEVFPQNPGHVLPGLILGSTGNYLCTPGVASAVGCGWDFFGPYNNSYGSKRIKENFSIVLGKHSLKMGYLYSWEFKNENNASGTNGLFTFPGTSSSAYTSTGDPLADFLLGRASAYTEGNIDITSHLRYDMHEAYIQDDWKLLPNLSLNLGVRWSFLRPPRDVDNVLTNFDPSRFDPARAYQISASNVRVPGTGDPLNGLVIAGQNSPFGDFIVASHPDTFGPRFGFAWDPFKTGKTAIRGGYGIYFDRTLSGIALQNAFVNPPFVVTAGFDAAGAAGNPTLASPTGGAQRNPEAVLPSLISMSPNFKIPTTQHWSLSIQRELWWDMSLDLTYAGNHGTHLLRAVRINQTLPGTVAPSAASARYRGWGTITERQTSASSRYDSLQVALNKRMTRGFQFGLAYTLSKVITDSPDDRTTLPLDVRNLSRERGLASFDKTHILVINWIWELPLFKNASKTMYNVLGGWQFGGIYRAESGTPDTVFISPNRANSFFGGSQRPDLVGNPAGPQTRNQWFNTAAFALPALNTFGNEGRSIFRDPGLNLWDLALYKNFKVTERVGAQFRAEFFNAFNHTNFLGVSTTLASTTFGQVTTAREPRQIQLGLKVNF